VDVTKEVEERYSDQKDFQDWHQTYFLGHKTNEEGIFTPETIYDKKLFIANDLAYQMRKALDDELHYKASCGIAHNKTLAKLCSGQNKPNA
jgi:nucleotidyltransferase/DNA polymerase involved in DNA repair